jgi:hypothetical protein
MLRNLIKQKQDSTAPTFFDSRETYPELPPGVRGFELAKGMMIFEIVEEQGQLRILNVELLHDQIRGMRGGLWARASTRPVQ